ncbi:hypothetical protein Y032_0109g116 [Ancylostoma ceylanicum]|uniref:Uncharacterized protein n=1 Tax=Ancylostoma ceylanicum TaxID=53326 RepID=A0A016TEU7_9BILA|nr:hypothetical protein Y032_0109g116 [Ancylostoma ceylanicum]
MEAEWHVTTTALKNPCIMLYRLSAEPRHVTCALSYLVRRGSADGRCSVRQVFSRETVLDYTVCFDVMNMYFYVLPTLI